MNKFGDTLAKLANEDIISASELQKGMAGLGKLQSLPLSPEAMDLELKDAEEVAVAPFMTDSKANSLLDKYLSKLKDVNLGPTDYQFMWRTGMYSDQQQIEGVPTRYEMKKAVMTLQRFSMQVKVTGSGHFLDNI